MRAFYDMSLIFSITYLLFYLTLRTLVQDRTFPFFLYLFFWFFYEKHTRFISRKAWFVLVTVRCLYRTNSPLPQNHTRYTPPTYAFAHTWPPPVPPPYQLTARRTSDRCHLPFTAVSVRKQFHIVFVRSSHYYLRYARVNYVVALRLVVVQRGLVRCLHICGHLLRFVAHARACGCARCRFAIPAPFAWMDGQTPRAATCSFSSALDFICWFFFNRAHAARAHGLLANCATVAFSLLCVPFVAGYLPHSSSTVILRHAVRADARARCGALRAKQKNKRTTTYHSHYRFSVVLYPMPLCSIYPYNAVANYSSAVVAFFSCICTHGRSARHGIRWFGTPCGGCVLCRVRSFTCGLPCHAAFHHRLPFVGLTTGRGHTGTIPSRGHTSSSRLALASLLPFCARRYLVLLKEDEWRWDRRLIYFAALLLARG